MRGIVLVALLSGALGCASRPAPSPAVDLAPEVEAIRSQNREMFEAETRRDIEGVMKGMAPDIVVQAAGVPEIRGAAALRQFYVEFFKLPIASITGGSLQTFVAPSGDIAYDVGWNRVQLAEPKDAPADSGKYLAVWRKSGGQWRVVAGSFTTNGPAKP